MNRHKFIWVAGDGAIAAATAAGVAIGGALSGAFPAGAVQARGGPAGETDPRRRAVAFAITAPSPHNMQPWQVDLRESGVITLFTDPARVLRRCQRMMKRCRCSAGWAMRPLRRLPRLAGRWRSF